MVYLPALYSCASLKASVLNIANEQTYQIVSDGVIKELSELFGSEHFHLGVDEVSYDCYSTAQFRQSAKQFYADHSIKNEEQLFFYFMDFTINNTLANSRTPIIWYSFSLHRTFCFI